MIQNPGGPTMAAPMIATAAGPAPMAATPVGARVASQSTVISGYPGQQFATYATPATATSQTVTAAAPRPIAAAPGQPGVAQQPLPQTAMAVGGSVATGAVPPPSIALQSTTLQSTGAGLVPPATPKIQTAPGGAPRVTMQPGTTTASGAFPSVRSVTPQVVPGQQQMMTREQVLEQRVRELEQLLGQKDAQIKELQGALSKAGVKVMIPGGISNMGASAAAAAAPGGQPKVKSPGRNGSSGFRKTSGSNPNTRYAAADQDCQIDVRLEEWYNTTGSAVQFRRINRGFYRFGDTIAELDIINHKLMARTEDGWNRGKFGPIDKFIGYYENIEREKAGIQPEA